jgi:alpha-glucosidase
VPLPSADASGVVPPSSGSWWRTAVVYQVYIRSFADGNGDGIGDIAGLRDRLPYLTALGVDAIWINPWYPSPQADGGYDVSDYRDIDPTFGTLDDAEQLIAEAHEAGLRVLLDIVPNHTSAQHAWFRAALAGDPRARSRYIFRAGRGDGEDLPPNDWLSSFGGPAWTRTVNSDGTPGDWYLHMFAPGQPDLDWSKDEVRGEFEDILRFWFDRGVDGFRIDVAHGLAKDPDLADAGPREVATTFYDPHPAWDQDDVHEIYRSWRKIADSYDEPRIFVAEAWVADNERLSAYLRPDELHTAFQFDFLRAPFRATDLREVIDDALAAGAAVGAPSTWVLSNHDVVRHVTRYARSQPEGRSEQDWERSRWQAERADLALGVRRARAAALLTLALPGTAYVYQGDELGLEEVEDIPSGLRLDPVWETSGHTNPGRDGCRVPIPWGGDSSPFGFSPVDATAPPWLPQPARWAAITAESQADDPASVLSMYAEALAVRKEYFADLTRLTWIPSPPQTLAFARGDVQCWVNTGTSDVPLPEGQLLLASAPGLEVGVLTGGATAWLVVR